MMLFHKNLRKIAEIIRNFLAKILKICPKKMYTLIRYGGNTPQPGAAPPRAAGPRGPAG